MNANKATSTAEVSAIFAFISYYRCHVSRITAYISRAKPKLRDVNFKFTSNSLLIVGFEHGNEAFRRVIPGKFTQYHVSGAFPESLSQIWVKK